MSALVPVDFDVDGRMDLAVDGGSDGLFVLPGQGDGTFSAPITIGGADARSIAAGDLDADGVPDLVHGRQIYYGNAASPLGHFIRQRVDHGPETALELADVDRDGFLDAISLTNDLIVRIGRADGSFEPPTTQPLGLCCTLAAGDLDGDGATDLAIADRDTLNLLAGTGDGAFTDAGAVATLALFPSDIAMADLDDDGALDVLAVTNGGLEVFMGSG